MDTEISIKEPTLSPLEKMYIRVYLHTLSHTKAYKAIKPELTGSSYNNNPLSKQENIKYHISKSYLLASESASLSQEEVIKLLYKEATSFGKGTSPQARIQALQLLGKHLGLFNEKIEEKEHITINVVQYDENKKVNNEDNTLLPLEVEEVTPSTLPENITIKEYGT